MTGQQAGAKKRKPLVVILYPQGEFPRSTADRLTQDGFSVKVVSHADQLFEHIVNPRCFCVLYSTRINIKPELLIGRAAAVSNALWILSSPTLSVRENLVLMKSGALSTIQEPPDPTQTVYRVKHALQEFQKLQPSDEDLADSGLLDSHPSEAPAAPAASAGTGLPELKGIALNSQESWSRNEWRGDLLETLTKTPAEKAAGVILEVMKYVQGEMGAQRTSLLAVREKDEAQAHSLLSTDSKIPASDTLNWAEFPHLQLVKTKKQPFIFQKLDFDTALVEKRPFHWLLADYRSEVGALVVPFVANNRVAQILWMQFDFAVSDALVGLLKQATGYLQSAQSHFHKLK